ncbi:alpha/beta hydrolase [Solimicrobium silvestre]|uniref:Alpha/beta hydrolase fold n=1 Tax=Solimicrobium silvestre TaxID=2099400 RepID=A0A2S9GXQ6_9BURK|nr:alpha/beta hydrolase [Solimicrobium silvestre]PRC92502.1 alpha/beta hydrolase fold [Solimicrobium silvestre]
MRILCLFLFAISTIFSSAHSFSDNADKFTQLQTQEPIHEPVQIQLWPDAVPDARPSTESETREIEKTKLVAGKQWSYISHVARPTMTIYSPKGANANAAVLVFPGGGYNVLAIDLEGTEVCDWLTGIGVTCIVLKYRVPHSGTQWNEKCQCQATPKIPAALEDAQRAVSLIRFHAAEWNIDPHKIGVLGFSAGGHLVAAVSTHFSKRTYHAIDSADQQSSRPDFAVALYPGHLSWIKNSLVLNPEIASYITAQTPTTFLLQNEDDHVDSVMDSLSYYVALRKAGVPVELHSYAEGGHAFGLRRTEFPATAWPTLVETWLTTIGVKR